MTDHTEVLLPLTLEQDNVTALRIRRGHCYAIYAYEVANSINLDEAERRLESTERQTIKQKQRAPEYFEYRPAPLRDNWPVESISIGPFSTLPAVDLVMYDFGAVSVSFAIPIPGSFSNLIGLAVALRGNSLLLAESRRQVERLLETLGPAADRPRIASIVEDYVIYQVDTWEPPLDARALYPRLGQAAAQVLRAETRPLSDQESELATAFRASYGPNDLTIIDTDAALVFDPDAADVRAVMEFANAQILEMRFLDLELDVILDRSYEVLTRQSRARRLLSIRNPEPWTVAQLQLDAAILFEQVTNALKLIGEQYLTRIYGMASRRFHLAAWDASINRKLQTIEGIYAKLEARASDRRLELLEWIIIVLIAFSIILPFLPGLGGK